MASQWSRRDWLRLASGAMLSLPLLDAGRAFADGAVPTRLVIYQTPEGNLPTLFRPASLANDELRLSPMLQPLSTHLNKLCVLSGVSNKIAPLHPAADGHTKTGKTLMTANVIASSADSLTYDANRQPTYGQRCLGPSIDHYLASRLQIAEPLNLALGSADAGENTMFYKVNAAGQTGPNPVAPLTIDPAAAFRANLASGGPTTTTREQRLRSSAACVAPSAVFRRK